MIDSIRNTVLAGLGAASFTKEKFEEVFKDLVEKGKLTKDEADGYIEKLSQEGQEAFNKVTGEASKKMDELLRMGPFATAADLKKLEKRITDLEAQITKPKSEPGAGAPGGGGI